MFCSVSNEAIFRPIILHSQISVRFFRTTTTTLPPVTNFSGAHWRAPPIGYGSLRCAATKSGGGDEKKSPARLAEVQRLLHEAEERYKAAGGGLDPIPKITLGTLLYSTLLFPEFLEVVEVNTKVDMRFNVKNANWLSERVRERIMQMEKNRINKDGEIVISSTKTRTQKGNTEDALAKLQAIIDAASYVPPPPSQETVKKIAQLSAVSEQKRLDKKKNLSQKKAQRRSRDSWD
ncbi:hypothetical protein BUALT_Bualt05G0071000 [Buddleja alternifolia]|uniref:Immature colon carcinoma transcript 1 protein n=1 Tax=Buddleja alternifolia TaxID=168488 RepID=A0AAV6XH68_9LAMI|nr:hypothetical protein BUALT_Bualt05G0071000 [Buddleja alternifolia]